MDGFATRAPMHRRVVFLSAALAAALSASACLDTVTANPNARFESNEPRVTRSNTTIRATILGAVHAPDLDVRLNTDVATARIVSPEFGDDYALLEPVAPGTTRVELVDRGAVVDALELEIVSVSGFRLVPAQGLVEPYPAVPLPNGVMENHRVILTAEAFDQDGLALPTSVDIRPERLLWDLTGSEPLVVQLPATPAGVYPFEVLARDGDLYDGELVIVPASDIVSMQIDWTVGDPRMSISVTGVTADGRHIIGLDVLLEVNGVSADSDLGSWLFAPLTPTSVVDVVARWNGLRATRTFSP